MSEYVYVSIVPRGTLLIIYAW